MKSLFAILTLSFLGCASGKVVQGPISHDRLFPDGTYRHDVALTVRAQDAAPEKNFNFSGVVQLKPDTIRVVALASFGVTAFRITENRDTREVNVEIYISTMKKFEPRLREYYAVLREALLAPSGSAAPGSVAGLTVDAPDKNGIPTGFTIDQPKFRVKVTVTGYEL